MLSEVTTTRQFQLVLNDDDLIYVDIYVTPLTEEMEERGIEGVNGYVMDHMVLASGYGVDMDEDQEIVMTIAHHFVDDINPDGDVMGDILRGLPL